MSVRALLPAPLQPIARSIRARWRTRRSNLRALHGELSSEGSPLATVRSGRTIEPVDADVSSEVTSLALDLLAARSDGPRLLDDVEWRRIEASTFEVPETLRMLQGFAVARRAPVVSMAERHRVVIDVRPLQREVVNGTVTHARAVTDAVFDALDGVIDLWGLVDPNRPIPPDLAPRLAGIVDPTDVADVRAFIETSPLEDKVATFALDTDPQIVRVGVWLDSIIGQHPAYFLPTSAQVFGYQYSLECVGVLDRVLALSEVSRSEAIALGVDADRIVVTGCVSSLDGVEPTDEPLPFERFVVIAGNMAPHKDVATALVGALAMQARDRVLGAVIIATPDRDQLEAVDTACDRSGISRDRVRFESNVPAGRMVQLLSSAQAVVVASQHEGFSLPVIEAIESGTPVVVSDIEAHRELLGSGRWMFEIGDPVELSSALHTVLRRPLDALTEQTQRLAERYDPMRLRGVIAEVMVRLIAR